MTVPVITLADHGKLLAHLDRLNELGLDDRCSGVTAHGEPFLAFLMGIYAESAGALLGDPWEGLQPSACSDCGVRQALSLSQLFYPVHVLAPHEVEAL